jgi:hypothetical protein
MEWWRPAVLDLRIQNSDLRDQNLGARNQSILNQQSEIINSSYSNTPNALVFFTGIAIET